MGRLDGNVALITGSGRGIGRAIALELAREGADIVISSRTQEQLDAVAAQAEALGATVLTVIADAMDRDQAKQPVRDAIARFDRLDILVNNVGGSLAPHDPNDHALFTYNDDLFVDVLTLNLTSTYWTARETLPHMRDRGYGRIINIGSGAAKRSGLAPMSYTAAKHGLVGLTRSMAALAAADGITVNCLCPGWTNTEGLQRGVAARRARDPDFEPDPTNLLNRILEPEELGPMAALLASPEAAGITGQIISVDGGYKV